MADNEINVAISGDIQKYQQALNQMVTDAQKTSAQISTIFGTSSAKMASGHAAATTSMRGETSKLLSEFEGAGEKINKVWERASHGSEVLLSSVLGIRTALAGLAAGFAVERLVTGFVEAGMELEKFKLQLQGVLGGSSLLAEDALSNLRKLTDEVPQSLEDLVSAYVRIREQGIIPTNQMMKGLADTAFITSKSVTEVVTAAVSQMPRVLSQMGVEIQKVGDLASVNGRIIADNRQAVAREILNVLATKNTGAIDAGAATTTTALAHLKSVYEEFFRDVGKDVDEKLAPIVDHFLDLWKGLEKDGTIQRFRDNFASLSVELLQMFGNLAEAGLKWVASFKPGEITQTLKDILGVFKEVGGVINDYVLPAINAVIDAVKSMPPMFAVAGGIVGYLLFGSTGLLAILGVITGSKYLLDQAERIVNKLPGISPTTNQTPQERAMANARNSWISKIPGLGGEEPAITAQGTPAAQGTTADVTSMPSLPSVRRVVSEWTDPKTKAVIGDMTNSIADLIVDTAVQKGIPLPMALALFKNESQFNPYAIGDNGAALGIGQLHTAAAGQVGVTNRGDYTQSIPGSLEYLRQQAERFGSWEAGAAAYQLGPTAYANRLAAGGSTRTPYSEHFIAMSQVFGRELGQAPLIAPGGGVPGVSGQRPPYAQSDYDFGNAPFTGFPAGYSYGKEANVVPWSFGGGLGTSKDEQVQISLELVKQNEIKKQIKQQDDNAVLQGKKMDADAKAAVEQAQIGLKTADLEGDALRYQQSVLTQMVASNKEINSLLVQGKINQEGENDLQTKALENAQKIAKAQMESNAAQAAHQIFVAGPRNALQDLQAQFQLERAVTVEERAQAQVNIDLQKYLRDRGIQMKDLTEEQKAQLALDIQQDFAYRKQTEALKDQIENWKKLRDEIVGALNEIVTNTQTLLSDVFQHMFDKGFDWKNLFKNFAEGLRKSVSDVMASIVMAPIKAGLEQLIKGIGGSIASSVFGIPTGGLSVDPKIAAEQENTIALRNLTAAITGVPTGGAATAGTGGVGGLGGGGGVGGLIGGIFGGGGLISGLTGGGWGARPSIGGATVEGPLMEGGGFFSSILGSIGSFLGFQHGGEVPGPIGKPLLAVVHGGETVLPDNRYMPMPIGMGNGSSGQGYGPPPIIHVHINKPVVQDDYKTSHKEIVTAVWENHEKGGDIYTMVKNHR